MINFFRKKPEEQKINKPNGSDSFERELDTELYGEEVENGNENEKQANIFDLSYSDEEYIKMGFYNCVHNTINGNELNNLVNKIEKENSELTDKVDSWFLFKVQSLENSINILKEKIEEIKQKKKIYEKELDSLLLSKNLIESEISKLREQSINLFKRVGSVKQDIIGKRFEAIKKELDSLVVIHQEIEKKQNESVTKEDKDKNQERIDFLKNIKTNWENSYKNINEKVTGFEGIGVNTTSANVLISIGVTSSIVAGWFFSLWTGPIPKENLKGNIVDNKSILFLIIDSITRSTQQYGLKQIIIGVVSVVILITLASYVYYKLLIYFGFVEDPRYINYEFNKVSNIEFELDLSSGDEFFKSQFKGNSWFSFWLKVSPFIILIFIFLAVLGKITINGDDDQLQDAYDSLINQNFGTLLCISLSGIFFLYVSKVIEPRFENKSENFENKNIKDNWEISIIIMSFIILIGIIVIYKSQLTLIEDGRKIFIIGFLISCMITGLCSAYGLRYKELISNVETFEKSLSRITEVIYKISTSVNYLNSSAFIAKVETLQEKMFRMINSKSNIVIAVINGNKYKEDEEDVDYSEDTLRKEYSKHIKQPINAFKNNVLLNYLFRYYSMLMTMVSFFNFLKKKQTENNTLLEDGLTQEEKLLFPELYVEIEELKIQINIKIDKVKQIDNKLREYLLEQGDYKSIDTQIEKTKIRLNKINKKLLKVGVERYNQQKILADCILKQKNLLLEGYNLGLWFVHNKSIYESKIITGDNTPDNNSQN